MIQAKVDAIEKQMQELKRETLRLKRIVLFAVAITLLVVLAGFQPVDRDRIVETTQLVLRDKNRKIRAKLSLDDQGLPTLKFYDQLGVCRMESGISESDDVGISILGKDGLVHAYMSDIPGSSSIGLIQPNGKQLFMNSIVEENDRSASISMGDSNGREEFSIEAHSDWATLAFLGDPIDENGPVTQTLQLTSDKKRNSEITISDKKDAGRLVIKGDAEGNASISIFDETQKKILTIPKP